MANFYDLYLKHLEKKRSQKQGGKIVLFSVLSAAVAAAAALLYAPQTGKKTRMQVRKIAGEVEKEAEEKMMKLKRNIEERVEGIRSQLKKEKDRVVVPVVKPKKLKKSSKNTNNKS